MSSSTDRTGPTRSLRTPRCPRWCVAEHGVHLGEEDWVHLSAPLEMADDVQAQASMCTVPDGGAVDGPYVLVGWRQYTIDEAVALGEALIGLATTVRDVSPDAGP